MTKVNGTTGIDKIQNGVVTLDNLSSSANSSLTESKAFRVSLTTSPTVSSGNPIVWNNVVNDTESAFNTSTGQYTIPTTGYWFFHLVITSASAQGTPYFYIALGGSRWRDLIESLSWTTNTERHASTLLYCTQGQVLTTCVNGTSFTVQGGDEGYHSNWQGFYLGN